MASPLAAQAPLTRPNVVPQRNSAPHISSSPISGCRHHGFRLRPSLKHKLSLHQRSQSRAQVLQAAATEEISQTDDSLATAKLRIKLKAFDVSNIREAEQQILDAAATTGAKVSGPIPLPTRIKRWCVLRSPHVNKDSREHFEIRIHQRLIDIKELTAETIDRFMSLDVPSGVDVNVKLM